jgi:hypothetical protein
MDTTRIDAVARLFDGAMTRRGALRSLVAGAAALAAGGNLLAGDEVAARKKRRKKARKQTGERDGERNGNREGNVCKGLNWCVDRSQTCVPKDGYGKCLVEASGENICAELLFQVQSCAECAAPNCTNCRCVLAAGGGDRCNNGANGYDFICVREV